MDHELWTDQAWLDIGAPNYFSVLGKFALKILSFGRRQNCSRQPLFKGMQQFNKVLPNVQEEPHRRVFAIDV